MGLLDGLDRMASGGLLGDLIDPSQLSDQQKRQRRGQLLMHLGGALSQGGFGALGEGYQNYQNSQIQQLMFLQALKQQAAQQQAIRQMQGQAGQVFQPPQQQAPLPPPGAMQAPPSAPPPEAMMQGASMQGGTVPGGQGPMPDLQAPNVPMAPPPMPPPAPIASPGGFQPPPVAQSPQDQITRLNKLAAQAAAMGLDKQAEAFTKISDQIQKANSNKNQGAPIVGANGQFYLPQEQGMPVASGIQAPPEKDRYVPVGTTHILDHTTGKLTELPKDKSIVEVNGMPAIENPDLSFSTLSGVPIPPDAVKQYNPKPGTDKAPPSAEQQAFQDALRKTGGDVLAAYRLVKVDPVAQANAAENRAIARGDQSFKWANAEIDTIAKPLMDQASKISDINDLLKQGSPMADALVAPKLLSVMVGGQGSGLRMNEAEISRIVGGRSNWQTLQAAANKWSLDPSKANSITPAQRQQIRSLVGAVTQKLAQKQSVVSAAQNQILASQDPTTHRQVVTKLKQSLSENPAAVAGAPVGYQDYLKAIGQ